MDTQIKSSDWKGYRYFIAPNTPIEKVYAIDKEGVRHELQEFDIQSEIKLAQEEYKQFILNILYGVDLADGKCSTKAIRQAINSRVITNNK